VIGAEMSYSTVIELQSVMNQVVDMDILNYKTAKQAEVHGQSGQLARSAPQKSHA
jgi:hypothetical protein